MATFTLINTAVGVGMLALPVAVSNLGYVPGFIMLFFGAANLFLSLYCFKYLTFKFPETQIYSKLVLEILKEKGEKALNWIFLVYCWSTLCSYVLVAK